MIVRARVRDPGAYQVYKSLAEQAIRLYGGRYLIRGGAEELLEGEPPIGERLVVVEFESPAQVKRFYASPEYQAAKATRNGVADMDISVVEGASLDDVGD